MESESLDEQRKKDFEAFESKKDHVAFEKSKKRRVRSGRRILVGPPSILINLVNGVRKQKYLNRHQTLLVWEWFKQHHHGDCSLFKLPRELWDLIRRDSDLLSKMNLLDGFPRPAAFRLDGYKQLHLTNACFDYVHRAPVIPVSGKPSVGSTGIHPPTSCESAEAGGSVPLCGEKMEEKSQSITRMTNPTRVFSRMHYEFAATITESSCATLISGLNDCGYRLNLDVFTEYYFRFRTDDDEEQASTSWRLYRSRGSSFYKCSDRLSFPCNVSHTLTINENDVASETLNASSWNLSTWRSTGPSVPWTISWHTFRLVFANKDAEPHVYIDISTDLQDWSVVITSVLDSPTGSHPVIERLVTDGVLQFGSTKLTQFARIDSNPNCSGFPGPLGSLLAGLVRARRFVEFTETMIHACQDYDSAGELRETVSANMADWAQVILPGKWCDEATPEEERVNGPVTY